MALAYNLPGALHTDSFTVGDYTYTGNSVYVDDGNGKWRIKFLSSGTFTPTKNVKVDIFAVDGGGGGSATLFSSLRWVLRAAVAVADGIVLAEMVAPV